jgi:hypothetical protein
MAHIDWPWANGEHNPPICHRNNALLPATFGDRCTRTAAGNTDKYWLGRPEYVYRFCTAREP